MKTTAGTVTFPENIFRKNVVVEITSDDLPELEAVYRLKIVSVDGGADIDPARNNLTFIIRYVPSFTDSSVLTNVGRPNVAGNVQFLVRPLPPQARD